MLEAFSIAILLLSIISLYFSIALFLPMAILQKNTVILLATTIIVGIAGVVGGIWGITKVEADKNYLEYMCSYHDGDIVNGECYKDGKRIELEKNDE